MEEMLATGNGFEEVPVEIREEAYHMLVFASCCFVLPEDTIYVVAYCIATLARCYRCVVWLYVAILCTEACDASGLSFEL